MIARGRFSIVVDFLSNVAVDFVRNCDVCLGLSDLHFIFAIDCVAV